MSTKKRILANALATAGVLALVGYMYAQLAGMWVSTQQVQRTALAEAPNLSFADTAEQVSETLMWRLPITLGIMGFLFVVIGESLLQVWRQPSPVTSATAAATASATSANEAQAEMEAKASEAVMQQLLKETERNPLMTPPPRATLKLDLSKIQTLEHAQ